VSLEHLTSPDGKRLAAFNIELDDTNPSQVAATGFVYNLRFAAISKGKSSDGWIFYGPAESGSEETGAKFVIRQTDPTQFDETIQQLHATSSTDPGSWITLVSGTCRLQGTSPAK
ncbi:MAG: hypothetical protein ACREJX_14030, partial [Polyangiaceae bacterium]